MQWHVTLLITHKLLLSCTTVYKTAPLLFCPHKWEFILRVSCPQHSCFIPALKWIASSKDLFPTSVIFKGKKKHQVPYFSSVEHLSSTTKNVSHLTFHYKISPFPGEQKAFQNHLGTKPERVFPKTEGIQQPDLNLHVTSLQLWKWTASLVINQICQNSSFRLRLKHLSELYTHTEYTQWVPVVCSCISRSSPPSKHLADTIHFSCLVHSSIASEIMHFIYVYS